MVKCDPKALPRSSPKWPQSSQNDDFCVRKLPRWRLLLIFYWGAQNAWKCRKTKFYVFCLFTPLYRRFRLSRVWHAQECEEIYRLVSKILNFIACGSVLGRFSVSCENFVGSASKVHRNSIEILSKFYRNSIEILSKFSWNSTEILSKFYRNVSDIQSKFYRNSMEILLKF